MADMFCRRISEKIWTERKILLKTQRPAAKQFREARILAMTVVKDRYMNGWKEYPNAPSRISLKGMFNAQLALTPKDLLKPEELEVLVRLCDKANEEMKEALKNRPPKEQRVRFFIPMLEFNQHGPYEFGNSIELIKANEWKMLLNEARKERIEYQKRIIKTKRNIDTRRYRMQKQFGWVQESYGSTFDPSIILWEKKKTLLNQLVRIVSFCIELLERATEQYEKQEFNLRPVECNVKSFISVLQPSMIQPNNPNYAPKKYSSKLRQAWAPPQESIEVREAIAQRQTLHHQYQQSKAELGNIERKEYKLQRKPIVEGRVEVPENLAATLREIYGKRKD